MDSNYITSAQSPQQFPEHAFPEFAFVGKSNCGKSSLLNALLQRKNLARQSSTPGRTQMINFFMVKVSQDNSFVLADLPGYGYSKTKKSMKAHWDKLITSYLETRSLSKILFLFDIRRKVETYELDYMKELHINGQETFMVLTKTDKLNQSERNKKKKELSISLKEAGLTEQNIIFCSVLNKSGIKELQKVLFHKSS